MTRFRYGDEQHLDEALVRIFKIGQPRGLARRLTPKLKGVREEVRGPENAYTLVLEFAAKPQMERSAWEERQEKFQSFFGPGVVALLEPTEEVGLDNAHHMVASEVQGAAGHEGQHHCESMCLHGHYAVATTYPCVNPSIADCHLALHCRAWTSCWSWMVAEPAGVAGRRRMCCRPSFLDSSPGSRHERGMVPRPPLFLHRGDPWGLSPVLHRSEGDSWLCSEKSITPSLLS